jgi:hypothetical protein
VEVILRHNYSKTTKNLQKIIGSGSIIFTMGTFIHNFFIINVPMIKTVMQNSNVQEVDIEAIKFTNNFRIIGCIYIIGNSIGIVSFKIVLKIFWWVILIINFTQGLGFIMIPKIFWEIVFKEYGLLGLLPTIITDGGGLILSTLMFFYSIKYKSVWGIDKRGK